MTLLHIAVRLVARVIAPLSGGRVVVLPSWAAHWCPCDQAAYDAYCAQNREAP